MVLSQGVLLLRTPQQYSLFTILFSVAKRRIIEGETHSNSDDEETLDLFSEYYRPSEITEFDELYPKIMPTSTKYVSGGIL